MKSRILENSCSWSGPTKSLQCRVAFLMRSVVVTSVYEVCESLGALTWWTSTFHSDGPQGCYKVRGHPKGRQRRKAITNLQGDLLCSFGVDSGRIPRLWRKLENILPFSNSVPICEVRLSYCGGWCETVHRSSQPQLSCRNSRCIFSWEILLFIKNFCWYVYF